MRKRKERLDYGIKARTGDMFAVCSWREMLYLSAPRLIPVVGTIALAICLNAYWQKVLLSVVIFGLLAISWEILSQSGMVSLGQSLFFGVGAYLSAIMNHYLGLSPFLAIPLATIGGGLFCTIILLPVMRLRGIYFAIVTMIIPLVIVRIIEATQIFGGTEGISGLTGLSSRWAELLIVVPVLLLALYGFRRMMASDYGLVLKGIGNNDQTVMSCGINTYFFKAQALFIASSVASFAGAFTTHVYIFVGMPVFGLDYSIVPIAISVVGGTGNFAGAVLGAFILIPLLEILRGMGGLRIVLYGICLIVFILILPEGIFPYIRRRYQQFERWVTVEK